MNLFGQNIELSRKNIDLDSIINIAKETFAVKNELLRKEHVTYCLAWNKRLGSQNRVVYNAIGPDVSTILLATNPTEIIGVDKSYINANHIAEFAKQHWNEIDTIPEINLAIEGHFVNIPDLYHGFSGEKKIAILESDIRVRNKRGYWDMGNLWRWSIERLTCIELKKMGVNNKSITSSSDSNELKFEWAFPNEEPKERTIKYINTTLENINNNFPSDIDCFYQKSIPDSNPTSKYIINIKPLMNKRSTFIIGQRFKKGVKDTNEEYKKVLQNSLGSKFKFIKENNMLTLIEELPAEQEGELTRDKEDGTHDYGMRYHVFRRG